MQIGKYSDMASVLKGCWKRGLADFGFVLSGFMAKFAIKKRQWARHM